MSPSWPPPVHPLTPSPDSGLGDNGHTRLPGRTGVLTCGYHRTPGYPRFSVLFLLRVVTWVVVAWLTGRALVQVRPDLSRLFSRPFRTHGSKELCSLADLCRVHAHGGWAASPSPPFFFLTGVGRLPPPPSCAGPTFHTRSAPLSLLASALTCPVPSAEFGWLTVSFPCQPLGSALLRYRTHAVVWR